MKREFASPGQGSTERLREAIADSRTICAPAHKMRNVIFPLVWYGPVSRWRRGSLDELYAT